MLRETRDMDAAQRCFRQAREGADQAPERGTTDGHAASPRASGEPLGARVAQRGNQELHHRLEHDHRGIKQRYEPMRGFGAVDSAARCCRAFEELRQFERERRTRAETGSLAERRHQFGAGTALLPALLLGA